MTYQPTDRYTVYSPSGEPGIRTSSLVDAERWASRLGGELVDHEAHR